MESRRSAKFTGARQPQLVPYYAKYMTIITKINHVGRVPCGCHAGALWAWAPAWHPAFGVMLCSAAAWKDMPALPGTVNYLALDHDRIEAIPVASPPDGGTSLRRQECSSRRVAQVLWR
jgi:hypothetical protein